MPVTPHITAMESPFLSKDNTGLGNCLFQIAAAFGIARRCGTTAVYDRLVQFGEDLQSKFGYTHATSIFRNFRATAGVLGALTEEKHERTLDTTVLEAIRACPTSLHQLSGYFESPEYFQDHAEELRTLLSPDEVSLMQLRPFLTRWEGKETVALHVRRNGFVCNGAIPDTYYECAIQAIETVVKDPVYLVFSDLPTEGEGALTLPFLAGRQHAFVKHAVDYLDLWAMASCKHFVLSGSTFCFWAWFLHGADHSFTVIPRTAPEAWYATAKRAYVL